MAIYDRDANAATAVTAFLAQFKIDASGDVTYVSGTDTFHVWWLHRALQKIAWDLAISGDDEINLSKPNPSTSEALGTIITLLDHTTDYSVRYNITDTVAEYLFGGSVEQQNASAQTEGYYGLRVLGSVNLGTTQLQILQNGALLTSHWSTGKNQTDANTLLRILVKGKAAGAEIDNQLVIVKASEYFDTHAIWETTLGLGEAVAAINTGNDPQVTTARATVEAYTGFATAMGTLEGYQQIDVDGAGADNFLGAASYNALTGNQNKKALYEVVNAALARGTTQTIFGIDGDLWTGRIFDCTVTPGAGSETWVQNESLTWTGGTGVLLAVDDVNDNATTRLILHLSTGVAPTNTQTVSGATAQNAVSGTPTRLTTAANHLGLFTGSNWIGAYGIGYAGSELTFGDSVTSLDGETPTVPQNVTITINVTTGLAGDDPHVFIAQKDPVLTAPDYTVYTLAAQGSGQSTIVVNEAIAADEPQDGWLLVLPTGTTTYKAYHYSSWATSTFTLDGTDHPSGTDEAFTNGDPAFVGIIYDSATGGGTSKSVANTYVYDGDIDIIGWVRHGDPAAPDRPVPISASVGSAGYTTTIVLNDES